MNPDSLLNEINDFYQQAWDKLLIYTGVLVGLIGILIPVIQNSAQRIRSKVIKKDLETTVKASLDVLEKNLRTKIDERLGEISKEVEDKVKNTNEKLKANIVHVQADNRFIQHLYKLSLRDYIVIAITYLNHKDYLHMNRANKGILESIRLITPTELQSLEDEESQPSGFISLLEEKNQDGLFTDFLSDLKREIKLKKEQIKS